MRGRKILHMVFDSDECEAIVVFLEVAFMVMLTTRVSVIQDGQEKIAIIVRQLQEFLIPFNGASYTGTTDLSGSHLVGTTLRPYRTC